MQLSLGSATAVLYLGPPRRAPGSAVVTVVTSGRLGGDGGVGRQADGLRPPDRAALF